MKNEHEEYPSSRACRGGSWYRDADALRCSSRSGADPGGNSSDVGFRVIRSSLFSS